MYVCFFVVMMYIISTVSYKHLFVWANLLTFLYNINVSIHLPIYYNIHSSQRLVTNIATVTERLEARGLEATLDKKPFKVKLLRIKKEVLFIPRIFSCVHSYMYINIEQYPTFSQKIMYMVKGMAELSAWCTTPVVADTMCKLMYIHEQFHAYSENFTHVN